METKLASAEETLALVRERQADFETKRAAYEAAKEALQNLFIVQDLAGKALEEARHDLGKALGFR